MHTDHPRTRGCDVEDSRRKDLKKSWPERPLSMRVRDQIQEVLSGKAGPDAAVRYTVIAQEAKGYEDEKQQKDMGF